MGTSDMRWDLTLTVLLSSTDGVAIATYRRGDSTVRKWVL
jgi:hypothetical protein